jgi:hypothetical protein
MLTLNLPDSKAGLLAKLDFIESDTKKTEARMLLLSLIDFSIREKLCADHNIV